MKNKIVITLLLAGGVALAGCSSVPTSPISTSALPAPTAAPGKPPTPVRTSKATQMYVWAGFKEKDCSPVAPSLGLSQTPAKGDVSFQPNQTITVQHSSSGKCVGQSMSGTGIYYTAKPGQSGTDSFTVTASTPSGQTVTRTFNVNIVE